jgi:hypothetical protein
VEWATDRSAPSAARTTTLTWGRAWAATKRRDGLPRQLGPGQAVRDASRSSRSPDGSDIVWHRRQLALHGLVNASARRGRPTTSGSFHASSCEAQVIECCDGGECVMRSSVVSREARSALAGSERARSAEREARPRRAQRGPRPRGRGPSRAADHCPRGRFRAADRQQREQGPTVYESTTVPRHVRSADGPSRPSYSRQLSRRRRRAARCGYCDLCCPELGQQPRIAR